MGRHAGRSSFLHSTPMNAVRGPSNALPNIYNVNRAKVVGKNNLKVRGLKSNTTSNSLYKNAFVYNYANGFALNVKVR